MTRASYFVPDLKTNIVTNIGTPVNPTDAANKAYVDSRAPLETDAAQNTGYGLSTLIGITSGTYNTSLGWEAAKTVTTGSTGTFIGAASGPYAAGAGNFITTLGYGSLAFSEALALGGLAQARGLRSVALGKSATATLDDQIMLGAAAHRVYVNNDPVAALEVATKQYTDTKVAKSGDTMSGLLIGTYFRGTGFETTTAANNAANIVFQTNGVNRWAMGKGPGTESTGNAGAEFNFSRWSDAGAWLSNPISINRATGKITIDGNIEMLGWSFDTGTNGEVSTDYLMASNYTSIQVLSDLDLMGEAITGIGALGGDFGDIVLNDNINANGNTIWGLADPPLNSDWAATKGYVDSKISGSIWVQAAAPVVSTPPTGYPLWLDTDEAEVSVALGNRNRLINGDFSVNQRGFSSSSSTNAYGFDRWSLQSNGGTITQSAQVAALGELPESARSYARITTTGQTLASHYARYRQSIESVRVLSGKTATVSFWAKAASGTPSVSVSIDQYYGAGGGSGTYSLVRGKVQISTTWTRYSITLAVPSVSGKTIGTGGDDSVTAVFYFSAGSDFNASTVSLGIQTNTFDIWGVQVEEGAVASPYEQRMYADELRACQRYFHRIQGTADVNYMGYAGIGAGNVLNVTSAFISIALPTALRGKPTVTTGGVTLWNGTVEKPVTGITTVYWSPLSPSTCFLDLLTSGLTVGQALVAYTSRNTSSYLEFNAEI